MELRFVVTPWRDPDELLQLRSWFYQHGGADVEDRRQHAVNKVLAWRVRKQELPLLLDSTADIVDAMLQDERNELSHNAVRLVYGTAISRFATGFTDTQLDLRRSRPAWLPANASSPFLDFPNNLLETRHNIVHRHLPPLVELKKAAQQSLEWLWEWYWSQLDVAFSLHSGARPDAPSSQDVKERLQGYLKAYVRSRKGELKGGVKAASKASKAADTASSSVLSLAELIPASSNPLLTLLVDEQQIIPSDRKIGDPMSGAFLIWSPILIMLALSLPAFPEMLLGRMMSIRNGRAAEPVKDAMLKWIIQILTSDDWRAVRKPRKLVEHVLEKCFISPSTSNLQLADALLQHGDTPDHDHWALLLSAAKDEGMEIDEAESMTVDGKSRLEVKAVDEEVMEKLSGPQKWVGLWRPSPIGALPAGWEDGG